MEITEQNERIANTILKILADENCTVEQAQSILRFLQNRIPRISTVSSQRLVLMFSRF